MQNLPPPEQYLRQILKKARETSWRGWDPYDALSSPAVRTLSLGLPWLRTGWIQLFKRSPINLRPIAATPKLQNPKALALFASAAWEMVPHWGGEAETNGRELLDRLERLATRQGEQTAWGYPFDWQSRAFYAPRNTPNVVVTSFCGHAFLDGFEISRQERYLAEAVGACQFILQSLQRTSQENGFCFSCTPLDRSRIHNANLLAASLLDRAAETSGREEFREAADQAVRYTTQTQRADGSWPYGDASHQQWANGFSTGFNLMALHALSQGEWGERLKNSLASGYNYYKRNFFLPDGTPRHDSNNIYPIDVHNAAVAILTFHTVADTFPDARHWARKVTAWTLEHLWNNKKQGFLYQKGRFRDIRISYLRWADAWMARALSAHINAESLTAKQHDIHASTREPR